jgi:hypothetical protein
MKNFFFSITTFFLLLFVLPSAIVSAATATTTVSVSVAAVITISSSGTLNLSVTPSGSGAQTVGSDTVTISTNDTAGYTLKISNSSASTANLISGSNTISPSAGTQASPTVPQLVNSWGYCVTGVGGFVCPSLASASQAISNTYSFAGTPLSATPNTLKATATTATNDTTTVWYGVTADTTKPSGTYTSTVTYTGIAN